MRERERERGDGEMDKWEREISSFLVLSYPCLLPSSPNAMGFLKKGAEWRELLSPLVASPKSFP